MPPSQGIDLEQYKTQAKELLEHARAGQPDALSRVRRHHPARDAAAGATPAALQRLRLADAQLVIAREHGLPSWPKFKELILFRNAVAALDAGDLPRLASLLDEHPRLIDYECRHGEWYESGYFAGATLLNHVAGNPIRAPLPANILDVARLLLDRGAGRSNAGRRGAGRRSADGRDDGPDRPQLQRTIGLLLTSKQASQAGVALPLVDLLVAAGAEPPDLNDPAVLDGPLQNLAPQTAEALIRRGARVDVRHAAALGRMDLVRRIVEGASSETTASVRQAADARRAGPASASPALSPPLVPLAARPDEAREQLGQAFLAACMTGHAEIAEYLLDHDADPAAGAGVGQTGLHCAVHAGDIELVRMLLRRGAPLEALNVYGGTVLAQALWSVVNEPHPNHREIIELLSQAGARVEPGWLTGIPEIDQLLGRSEG